MFPLELLSERVMQPLKGLIAHELSRRGFSQSRIGQILGISQPAVSAYLKLDRGHYERRLAEVGLSREEVDRVVDVVIAAVDQQNYPEAVEYLNNFVLSLLSSLRFCEFHKRVAPYLKDCDVCKNISIINDVKNRIIISFNMLKNNKYIINLVPRVLMNIVELSGEGPIGYPGRISVVGETLATTSEPQLWGAKFLGKLILAINNIHKDIKAVINIKYDEGLIDCIKKYNYKYAVVGPSNTEEESIENITSAMRSRAYDVVFDRGGIGIEANGYVFGFDAPDAATKILKIARCRSGAQDQADA
ncbi:MAG: thiamine-phosphate synthase family protein [Thermoproteus sp.]|jgi:predicted fused transcriptional regulator/phosphomethylpyrimidine kinase/predicted transcriptional regulator